MPKPPTTLAQLGVPTLVIEHDGFRAAVTLSAVHRVPPLDGAEDMHVVYVFKIRNVGTKPFDWNENQLWTEDGSLADVTADSDMTNASRKSIADEGRDLTPFAKWGQPLLIGSVKPGAMRRGIVSASDALEVFDRMWNRLEEGVSLSDQIIEVTDRQAAEYSQILTTTLDSAVAALRDRIQS